MLSKTGFTHSALLCWQIDYAGGSLNMNGTIMRDTYKGTIRASCISLLAYANSHTNYSMVLKHDRVQMRPYVLILFHYNLQSSCEIYV
ncbi:hypothetical protein CGA24_00745 (plasmid) [Salmonella enterica subsp. enterica]|nr:hypothetical protein CGA24_00745 [Salmonella enterica subsp. enterica]